MNLLFSFLLAAIQQELSPRVERFATLIAIFLLIDVLIPIGSATVLVHPGDSVKAFEKYRDIIEMVYAYLMAYLVATLLLFSYASVADGRTGFLVLAFSSLFSTITTHFIYRKHLRKRPERKLSPLHFVLGGIVLLVLGFGILYFVWGKK